MKVCIGFLVHTVYFCLILYVYINLLLQCKFFGNKQKLPVYFKLPKFGLNSTCWDFRLLGLRSFGTALETCALQRQINFSPRERNKKKQINTHTTS